MQSPCKAANWQHCATHPQAVVDVVHFSSDNSFFHPCLDSVLSDLRIFSKQVFLFLSFSVGWCNESHSSPPAFYTINRKDNLNWHRSYKICQSVLSAICHSALRVEERGKHPPVHLTGSPHQVPECLSAAVFHPALWTVTCPLLCWGLQHTL